MYRFRSLYSLLIVVFCLLASTPKLASAACSRIAENVVSFSGDVLSPEKAVCCPLEYAVLNSQGATITLSFDNPVAQKFNYWELEVDIKLEEDGKGIKVEVADTNKKYRTAKTGTRLYGLLVENPFYCTGKIKYVRITYASDRPVDKPFSINEVRDMTCEGSVSSTSAPVPNSLGGGVCAPALSTAGMLILIGVLAIGGTILSRKHGV